jgi:hypothetical protein
VDSFAARLARQPLKAVRYSIATDRVAEVYETYSHNGDLSSYVQTATQEVFKAVTARYSAPDLIAKRSQNGQLPEHIYASAPIPFFNVQAQK